MCPTVKGPSKPQALPTRGSSFCGKGPHVGVQDLFSGDHAGLHNKQQQTATTSSSSIKSTEFKEKEALWEIRMETVKQKGRSFGALQHPPCGGH